MANTNSDSKKKTSTKKATTSKTLSTKQASSTKKSSGGVSKSSTVKKTGTRSSKPKVEETKVPAIVQEENHFGRTILAATIIVLIFFGGYLGINYKMKGGKADVYEATQDETRFKKEYEELNGTTRENGNKNKDVTIDKENHIVYINEKEAVDLLDSGTGIIYFGYAACAGCRNFAPVLIDAAKSSGIEKIYYLDIRSDDKDSNDIRDIYSLNEKNRPKMVKEATDSYAEIKLMLANYLREYILKTSEGKSVSVGEKRLYAPAVVAVDKGEVIGYHEGTGAGYEMEENGSLSDLTKDEETELFNKFTTIFGKYLGNGCQEDGC